MMHERMSASSSRSIAATAFMIDARTSSELSIDLCSEE